MDNRNDYLVSFYQNRHCKGLCAQVESTGMCMGICTVSDEFALECYQRYKDNPPPGKPLVPIEFFEKQLAASPPKETGPSVKNISNSSEIARPKSGR